MKTIVFIVVLLLLAAFGYWYFYVKQPTAETSSKNTPVSAKGSTKPLNVPLQSFVLESGIKKKVSV